MKTSQRVQWECRAIPKSRTDRVMKKKASANPAGFRVEAISPRNEVEPLQWDKQAEDLVYNANSKFIKIPTCDTSERSGIVLSTEFFDSIACHHMDRHSLLEDDNYSLFTAYGWSSTEQFLFFKGLARYSRLQPELIAKRIGTKNVLQVKIMLQLLENLSSLCSMRISVEEFPRASVQPASLLREELRRANRKIKREVTKAYNNDIPFDAELFNHVGWILLGKEIHNSPDVCIMGASYVEMKRILVDWLRDMLRKLRVIARERRKTFHKENKFINVIDDSDVQCLLLMEKQRRIKTE